jgi:4-amino-4-deoxy-L-arabinose transferase-like glycosyltransferase
MSGGGPHQGRLERLAAGLVAATALPGFVLLLALAGRYGYHRDELYFVACGRHLTWGFVDQPPITPALARVADLLAPGSPAVLHVWPAMMYVALVFMTGVIARELGAARTGQVVASAATAAGTGPLVAGHILSTQTLDLVTWAVVIWLVIRLVRTSDPRIWIGIGVAAGVGLENKWTLAFLLAALLLALLTTERRRLVATWWFAGGVAIALALWAPNLAWQASHDWPQLDLLTAIRERSGGTGPFVAWLPFQLLLMGPVMAPVAIAGFVRLLRGRDVRPYRFLAFALVALGLVMWVIAPDKPYYVTGFYAPLAGAGAVPVERWLARRKHRPSRWLVPAALGVLLLPVLPIGLPIAPERDLGDLPVIDEQVEAVGWPQLARTVADAWRDLPPEERRGAIILTANYGEAGALDRYGPGLGLPAPYSVHNSYWWWRVPPAKTRTVLLVGWSPGYAARFFVAADAVATFRSPYGVENEEDGAEIVVATGPRRPMPSMWLAMRNYS